MKIIIAGSRLGCEEDELLRAIETSPFVITEVVSGGAKGVDTQGENWAKANNLPIKQFPADWKKLGKSAGPRRNLEMAGYADGLIAIWDGKSRGTGNMIHIATISKMPVWVFRV